MFNFTTSDELYEQCWVDTQYQAVLGFGNEPPPVALHLQGMPTEEHLSSTISNAVQSTFQALAGELTKSLLPMLVEEMWGLIWTEVKAILEATTTLVAEAPILAQVNPGTMHSPSPTSSALLNHAFFRLSWRLCIFCVLGP
ncbi:hypothetical protein APHAL10511_003448 [Amanita phalloides]|nr:hypothetical protein APHAL10511_003448 [Amanita phalloides]